MNHRLNTLLVLITAGAALADGLALRNPSMTDGEAKPDGWTQEWIGSGKVAIRRDTATYHSEPASLGIEALDGAAKAQAFQSFDVKGGEKITPSAWLRSEGGCNAMLAIQSFSDDWKTLDFKVVGNAMTGFDWKRVSGEVTLPADARRAAFVLLADGTGSAWMDDVSLDGSDPAVGATPKNAPPPPSKKPPQPEDPKLRPITATPGFWPDFPDAWMQTHAAHVKRTKENQGPLDIVLFGDSLTQGWGGASDGKPFNEAWRSAFGPRKAINFGVGGNTTQSTLYHLAHGVGDGMKPRVVVLAIGVNNVWDWTVPEAAVAEGVQACIDALRKKFAEAKIVVVNPFTNQEKANHPNRQRGDRIRAAIRKLDVAKQPGVLFVDIGDQFLKPDGTSDKDLMPDFIHLSPAAYTIYAGELKRVVDPLLKP